MKRAFIDLETTGLWNYKNGVTQIAIIVEIDDVKVASTDIKVRPFPQDAIDARALEVQNKCEDEILSYPEPMEAMDELSAFLGQFVNKYDKHDKFAFLAYNVDFDEGFLRKFFQKCGDKYFGSWFWNPSICIMRLAMHHLQNQRAELPNFKLATVCQALEIESDEGEGLHDAFTDIDLAHKLYQMICEYTKWS